MTKEDLKLYREYQREIEIKKLQIKEIESQLYNCGTPNNDGMPKGSNKDNSTDYLLDRKSKLEEKVKALQEKQAKIEDAINSLGNPGAIAVLECLYIMGYTLEQTAKKLHFSVERIKQRQKYALELIKEYPKLP